MKNFSKTIDLGTIDCCCVRQGATEVKFLFWFRENRAVLDAAASKDYSHGWLVDELFDSRLEQLAEEARKTAELVMQQMEQVGDVLEDGVALTIKNPVLNQVADEDEPDNDEDDDDGHLGEDCPVCGYPLSRSGECSGNGCGADLGS